MSLLCVRHCSRPRSDSILVFMKIIFYLRRQTTNPYPGEFAYPEVIRATTENKAESGDGEGCWGQGTGTASLIK